MLVMREAEGVETLRVSWTGVNSPSTFRWPIACPFMEPLGAPAVVHWVIDTTEPVAEAGVKGFINGNKQTISLHGNPAYNRFPSPNATIDLQKTAGNLETTAIFIGTEALDHRTANTKIWYTVIYDRALTAEEIAEEALALATADDP